MSSTSPNSLVPSPPMVVDHDGDDVGMDDLPSPKVLKARAKQQQQQQQQQQQPLSTPPQHPASVSLNNGSLLVSPPMGASTSSGTPQSPSLGAPGRVSSRSILKRDPSQTRSASNLSFDVPPRRGVSFVVPSGKERTQTALPSSAVVPPPTPTSGVDGLTSPPEHAFSFSGFSFDNAPPSPAHDRQRGKPSVLTASVMQSHDDRMHKQQQPRIARPTPTSEDTPESAPARPPWADSMASVMYEVPDTDANGHSSEVDNSSTLVMGTGAAMAASSNTEAANNNNATSARDESGQDDNNNKNDAGQSKKKKKKTKVHPLFLVPQTPWRAKLRSIFFPMIHRRALAVRDQEVPLEDPRFGDWFENLMVLFIFINVIILALFDPYEDDQSTRFKTIFTFQIVITFVFQFELAVRAMALGFRRMLSPLRFLDGVIILMCTASLIAQLAGHENRVFGVSVLRTPRLLRPLKNLGALPAVTILVDSLSQCLVKIGDASLMFFSLILIFSVAFVGVFGAALRNQCVNNIYFSPNVSDVASEIVVNFTSTNIQDYVCGGPFDVAANISVMGCNLGQTCSSNADSTFGLKGFLCPYNYTCMSVQDPTSGYVGFDNIYLSFVTLFVSSSQQSYFGFAGYAADSTDPLAYVYFGVFVIIAVLLVNLTIVIITVDFDLARARAEKNYAESGKTSRFQDLVGELIRQRRAIMNTGTETAETGSFSDNAAVAMAQRGYEETARAANKVREFLGTKVLDAPWFFYLMVALICVQVVALSLVFWGMSDDLNTAVELVNNILLVFFTIETIIRFVGKPFKEFRKDYMNFFDVVINVLGWVEWLVLTSSDFRFLRALRVVRALKLLKLSPGVYHWMQFILKSVQASPVILLMLSFYILIFALIGMQLLGGNLCNTDTQSGDNTPDCPNRPRANFDTFGHALITSFQIITGDNWDNVMDNAMQANGGVAALLFIPYYYLGTNILLALFIGILLSARTDDQKDKPDQAEAAPPEAGAGAGAGGATPSRSPARSRTNSAAASPAPQHQITDRPSAAGAGAGLPPPNQSDQKVDMLLARTAIALFQKRSRGPSRSLGPASLFQRMTTATVADEETDDEEMVMVEAPEPAPESEADRIIREREEAELLRGGATQAQIDERRRMRNAGRDSFVTAGYTPSKAKMAWKTFRSVLRRIMQHPVAHGFSCVIVVAASVVMAIRDPIAAPDTTLAVVCDTTDTVVKYFYLVETILNMLAFGIIRGKNTYLKRNRWNVFDTFITVVGVVLIIMKQTRARNSIYYRMLDSCLALRPLSLVRYSTSMNLVARALGSAVYEMRFPLAAIVLVIYIFAIIGTNLFMGKLRNCQIGSQAVMLPRANCTQPGMSWSNTSPNFDNVIQSLYTLFVIITLELWSPIMYRAMDYNGDDNPPSVNAYPQASLFFIIFAVVGGFIMVNIFMSVLVDSYNKSKRSVSAVRSLKLTREINGWLGTNKRLIRALPKAALENVRLQTSANQLGALFGDKIKKSDNAVFNTIGEGVNTGIRKVRDQVRRLLDAPWFTNLCFLVIFASFIAMAADHRPENDTFISGMNTAQIVFTALFAVEAALKIFGEGWTMYFASGWNRFDFFVVVISIVMLSISSYVNGRIDALFRSLRILRLARVAKGKSSLSDLINKFGHALANMGGVAAIIFIFMFMFAVLGISLFGRVVWNDANFSDGISHMANFTNIGQALFMILRISGGGDWWYVWYAVRPNAYGCDDNLGNCGPPQPIPQLYFVVTISFCTYVLKNLLVAVMVDQFSSAGDLRAMNKLHSKALIEAWLRCDPEMTMTVTGFDVLPIIRAIPRKAPIGFNRMSQQRRVGLELRMLMYMRIKDPKERNIRFEDVVDMLCHMAYETPPPEERPFGMQINETTTDDEATLSATLIVINQVARRLLHARRKRKAALAAAAMETSDRAEANMSIVNNPSLAFSSSGSGGMEDASRPLLGSEGAGQRGRGKSRIVAPRLSFAQQLFAADNDQIEFTDSDSGDDLPPPPPKKTSATVAAAGSNAVTTTPAAVGARGAVTALPDFDDSESSSSSSDSEVDDDDDGGQKPFLAVVTRKARKSLARVAQSAVNVVSSAVGVASNPNTPASTPNDGRMSRERSMSTSSILPPPLSATLQPRPPTAMTSPSGPQPSPSHTAVVVPDAPKPVAMPLPLNTTKKPVARPPPPMFLSVEPPRRAPQPAAARPASKQPLPRPAAAFDTPPPEVAAPHHLDEVLMLRKHV